jgi:heat-inducible transcriptional repressor
MSLDKRKELILRAVVFEYVHAAEPVGSQMLTDRHDLGVKPATVRNELAEMADMGYLDQPHTSAGRIPSDRGYRYFVDNFVSQRPLDPDVRARVKEVTESEQVLQDLLQGTTHLLSRISHLMTAGQAIRNADLTIRSVMITAMSAESGLLVVVLTNGQVENRVIKMPSTTTLSDIGRVNEVVGKAYTNIELSKVGKVRHELDDLSPVVQTLLGSVHTGLKTVSKALTRSKVVLEGKEYLYAQPEFQRNGAPVESLLHAMDMEEDGLGGAKLPQPTGNTTTALIGHENAEEVFRHFTILHAPFKVGDQEAGSLAIIGPTRLDYEATIPLLDYAAKALSQTLTQILK